MAWHHVSDAESVDTEERAYPRDSPYGKMPVVASKTLALSVYRCGSCRALCVVKKGEKPTGGCGKCGVGKPDGSGRRP